MNEDSLQRFIQLISKQTGLYPRKQDVETLRETILWRLKFLKLSTAERYYQLLKTNTAESHLEWEKLASLLTTGETFFFRDKGQFSLLQNWILPNLIKRRKPERSLRIWSAGCSTGEEAYSLAILADELLPRRRDWNIFVLGTDINAESIEKAKKGVYSSWSFRLVNPDLQLRYFRKRKTEWELDERIRTMVTFRSGNLLKDQFPSHISDIYDMDLILCRNVFIYFNRDSVSLIVEKFANTLRNGGYLMTGHAELQAQNLGRLRSIFFPESLIYRRGEGEGEGIEDVPAETRFGSRLKAINNGNSALLNPILSPNSDLTQISEFKLQKAQKPKSPKSETMKFQALLTESETLFLNGDYATAIEKTAPLIKNSPRNFDLLYLMAQAHANLGEYDKAVGYCQQALEVEPFTVRPYYLLAHIAEDKGNLEEAKSLLKKIIYLSPSFVAAYLELGALYEREYDTARARKARATALELLKALPSDASIEPYGKLTAGELLLYVQKMI